MPGLGAELEEGRRALAPVLARIDVAAPREHSQPAERYDESSTPIVQLVDLIIEEAIRRRASDIHIEPGEQQGLAGARAQLSDQEKKIGERKSALDQLEREVAGLGAEPFDNAAWLRFVAAARDLSARGLLLDSATVREGRITLSGSPDRLDPVLRLYESLSQVLGQSAVRMRRLDSEKTGRSSFLLELDRRGPFPPRLPGSKG